MKTRAINSVLHVVIVTMFFAATAKTIIAGDRNSDISGQDESKPVTIDASKFATLQAAFDAIPESGGEVIIPPGSYELTEPLMLTTQDTDLPAVGTR